MDFSSCIAGVARTSLAHLPTPLEPLPRLTRRLGGPQLFIKRDDATGLAVGGNKARKLEFLIADALAKGADALVTVGAVQSNHARQTAAAAARHGLACALALTRSVPVDTDTYRNSGNVLIDRLTGATLHHFPGDSDPGTAADAVAADLRRAGRNPYVIPIGGSNAVGSLGYALAAAELLDQADALGLKIDAIVHGTGSGGTQAGLLVGLAAAGRSIPVIGISVSASMAKQKSKVGALIESTAALLGFDILNGQVIVDDGFVGPAYGVPTAAMREAIALVAEYEGILLDPVYTGKAMAGLIARIRRGEFSSGQTVVFIHTGGTPALFAYADEFSPKSEESA